MVVPANPAPSRREGWRLVVPTPADLRRPRPAQPPAPPSGEPPRLVAVEPPEAVDHEPAELDRERLDRERPADPPTAEDVAEVAAEIPTPVALVTPAVVPAPNPGNLPRPHVEPPKPKKEKSRGGFGRASKKLRHSGLRSHRLPKVEETSAGGVVLDLRVKPARVALIARHDRRSRLLWSLPKGHVESGETPAQAALREVHEETGLIGRVIAPLGVIDFWFVVEDKRIHKTVHHFVIEAIGGELSDEDIEVEAVEWVPFDQVVRRLAYGDERRLVEKVLSLVPGIL